MLVMSFLSMFALRTVLLLTVFLSARPVLSMVRLPQWFSDGMVLQTSEENGPTAFLAGITEPPGEHVRIHGDAGEYSVTSEPGSGHWKVHLVASTLWNNTDNMTIIVAGATGAASVTVTVNTPIAWLLHGAPLSRGHSGSLAANTF